MPGHDHTLMGSHDPILVVLSLVIAALASYAALDLAGRVRSAEGSTRYGWLTGGATVMGLGIWSMHFVAMLAFRLPVPIAYDLPRMLLSVAVAIGASLLALTLVSRAELHADELVFASGVMGAAIAGMHYLGMESMRVGADLTYNQPLVVLSVVIAIVASFAALGLAFSFRSVVSRRGRLLKSVSAVVMGVAIAGMHYTGMAAARFVPDQTAAVPSGLVIATKGLAVAVVAGSLTILALALIGSVIDRRIQAESKFRRELTERTLELALQFEESRRLAAELETMNADLQVSLEDAERARRRLAEEHAAYAKLQGVAQREAAKARWLEGIAETTTAVAHEVNNPLTALIMYAELLREDTPDEREEAIAQIQIAARRIAAVINRLVTDDDPRSVVYVGRSRMLDLSATETR